MAFKTRDLLVRQRTQAINALRGHMSEYGVVALKRRSPLRDWRARSTVPMIVGRLR